MEQSLTTVGLVVSAFGVCGICAFVIPREPSSIGAWFLCGWALFIGLVVGVYSGLTNLTRKTVVDGQGITRSYWFGTDLHIAWEDVESWSIVADRNVDNADYQLVEFLLRGGKKVGVSDTEVFWPGFDQFVADVRTAVGAQFRGRKIKPS